VSDRKLEKCERCGRVLQEGELVIRSFQIGDQPRRYEHLECPNTDRE
jgi:hypothetical protein